MTQRLRSLTFKLVICLFAFGFVACEGTDTAEETGQTGGTVATGTTGNGGNTGASGRVFEVTLTPLSDQPRLLISNAADELTWDTGGPGARYMIEDSTDLVNWAERATGLTSLNYTLGAPTEPRRFFMLHSSIPAAP